MARVEIINLQVKSPSRTTDILGLSNVSTCTHVGDPLPKVTVRFCVEQMCISILRPEQVLVVTMLAVCVLQSSFVAPMNVT